MNKIINIKCPNCASEVHYDGIKEQFICKHCHHKFKINDVKNTNYNSQKKINNCIKIQEYYCNNCGLK